ncbi:MAG TPA: YqgE/AlgH family protein [Mycobacteriales bacterium]|jgi:putative transcriptional regulator|nr:YqgE/AlgH family protein [Mycobacteriales bacterium]
MSELALKGKLLVASPLMREPTFARTVISVLEHNDEGALGVVINRPGDAWLLDIVPPVADFASQPAVLFAGGPVEPQAAIALGVLTIDAPALGIQTQSWRPVVHPVVTVDLDVDPDLLATSLRELRVFAGYAGWSAGQLEGEIELGAWYVVESLPLDAFDAVPDRLWSAVLRRQPWPLSAVASAPIDPTMN